MEETKWKWYYGGDNPSNTEPLLIGLKSPKLSEFQKIHYKRINFPIN